MNPQALMAAMMGQAQAESQPYDISKAKADGERLKKLADAYDVPVDYAEGDLIEWKPGLKDTRNKLPDYGQPVICRQIKLRQQCDSHNGRAAVSYADLCFGSLVDGGYIEFIDDQQRFRKYRPPQDDMPAKEAHATGQDSV